MVRSPEQYLSEMDFSAPGASGAKPTFNASERAFVEKYLGLDTFEKLPVITPGGAPAAPKPVKTMERPPKVATPAPEIVVAKPVAPATRPMAAQIEPTKPASAVATPPAARPAPTVPVQTPAAPATQKPQPARTAPVVTPVRPAPAPVQPRISVKAADPTEIQTAAKGLDLPPPPIQKKEVPQPAAQKPAPVAPEPPAAHASEKQETQSNAPKTEAESAPPQRETKTAVAEAPPAQDQVLDLREQLKREKEIQIVSFLVAGQIFLLPVAGIQEVLRYQELVKVPQAPDFVAGVINLRGRVTPLVHLTALLTNAQPVYNEKNFIIICGGAGLQLGLIIDRISGMHVLQQNKIIWNAEAKLGESAEFLSAIADLDDKVCGIVAPEAITRKILAK